MLANGTLGRIEKDTTRFQEVLDGLHIGDGVGARGSGSGPVVHVDGHRDPCVAHPAEELSRPSTAVVGGRAKTEGDNAEEVVKEVPRETKEATPDESQGEPVVVRLHVTSGYPPAWLDKSRQVVDGAELERWCDGVGVELLHGVVQDQATLDGPLVVSDKHSDDRVEGFLGREVGVEHETGASSGGRTDDHSQGIEQERGDSSKQRSGSVDGAGSGEGVELRGDEAGEYGSRQVVATKRDPKLGASCGQVDRRGPTVSEVADHC